MWIWKNQLKRIYRGMKAFFCYACQRSFVHPFPVSSPTSTSPESASSSDNAVRCFYCQSEFVEELAADVCRQLIPGILHDQSVYAAQHGRILPGSFTTRSTSSLPVQSAAESGAEPTTGHRVFQFDNDTGGFSVSVQVFGEDGDVVAEPVGAMFSALQQALPANFLADGASILTPLFQAVGITDGDPRQFVQDPQQYREFLERLMQRLFPSMSPRQRSPGLTDEQLQDIPLIIEVPMEGDCAICREPFAASEATAVRRLPCQHLFHESCIFPWLKRVPSCPMCRKPVIPTAPSEHELDAEQD
jgi:hypothetical protein